MRLACTIAAVTVLLTVPGASAGRQAVDQNVLQVRQEGDEYLLTVPSSRLLLRLPKSRWTPRKGGPDGSNTNPRYFYFDDQSGERMLVASGWFEPEASFKGVEAFWSDESAALKRAGFPDAQNVSFEDVGSWKAILYSQSLKEITSAHIRAHWVQAGTWIDVHLSLTSFRPAAEGFKTLRAVLRGISVSEKPPGKSS
jgi:hypothetical protein